MTAEELWDECKPYIRMAITSRDNWDSYDYLDVVKLLYDNIIDIKVNEVEEIDKSENHGPIVYLVPLSKEEKGYLITYLHPSNDTLQKMQENKIGVADEECVDGLVELCRKIFLNTVWPYQWRE